LLLFLCSTLSACTKQWSVQCSDGAIFLPKAELEALPGLNIGYDYIKRPQFPRYCKNGDNYIECGWVPTVVYMKNLISYIKNPAIDDYRKLVKDSLFISFKELYVMYHDYLYLLLDKNLCNEIVYNLYHLLDTQLFDKQRQKKEHWTFMIQYFSNEESNPFFDFTITDFPTRDTMINYWIAISNQ
jgi:hypothetical protein